MAKADTVSSLKIKAKASISKGDYKTAIWFFKKALKNPFYKKPYLARTNLGWAYYKLGEKKKAINTLLQALKENAQYGKALVYLGLVYMDQGKFDSAEFYLKRAIRVEENSAEARYYLAEIYFREGKIDLAKELWNAVIQLAPQSKWAELSYQRLFLLKKLNSSKKSS